MKLIIDIGNTSTKMVAFDGDEPVEEFRCPRSHTEGVDKFANKYSFSKCIISCVSDIPEDLSKYLSKLSIPTLQLTHDTPIPIQNQYKTPKTLGMDRLAAAVGAHSLYPDRDLLVIDAGTCITYEFVEANGIYHGGNIAPGMQMRLKALHAYTTALPLVASEGDVPETGYNTDTAIRSGVIQGIKFEIQGYIDHFLEKYPRLLVFLTGGDNFNFDTRIKNIIFVDKFLVPRGLNRILDHNNDKL